MIVERLALPVDEATLAACRSIEEASFPGARLDFLAELARPFALLWAARPRAQAAPAGYLLAWRLGDELEIHSVASAPSMRRAGVGRALVEAALSEARRSGCGRVLLEVRAGNTPALSLYRRLGFAEEGRRARYYSDPIEDAVLMGLATP